MAHGPIAKPVCTSSPPSEPRRNGYVESFNSRIRDESLNINSSWSLAQARLVIGDRKYDTTRVGLNLVHTAGARRAPVASGREVGSDDHPGSHVGVRPGLRLIEYTAAKAG